MKRMFGDESRIYPGPIYGKLQESKNGESHFLANQYGMAEGFSQSTAQLVYWRFTGDLYVVLTCLNGNSTEFKNGDR